MSRRIGKRLKVPVKSPLGIAVLDPNNPCRALIRVSGGETPTPGDKVLIQDFITPVHAQRFCTKKNAEIAQATPEQRQQAMDDAAHAAREGGTKG